MKRKRNGSPGPAKMTLRDVLKRYRTTYFNLSERTHRFYSRLSFVIRKVAWRTDSFILSVR